MPTAYSPSGGSLKCCSSINTELKKLSGMAHSMPAPSPVHNSESSNSRAEVALGWQAASGGCERVGHVNAVCCSAQSVPWFLKQEFLLCMATPCWRPQYQQQLNAQRTQAQLGSAHHQDSTNSLLTDNAKYRYGYEYVLLRDAWRCLVGSGC
eukprot:GHUV01021823.1.p2 GENE.GHUV01021823.1~~GHUV01021823.1.p2  ORF type:complete len:152 (+),score=23.71 GHUV01021823.1:535-990(+)